MFININFAASEEKPFKKIIDVLRQEDITLKINGKELIFKTNECNDSLANFTIKDHIPIFFVEKFFQIIYEPFYKKNNIYLCFSDLIRINGQILKFLATHLPEKDLSLYDGAIEYKAFFLYNEDEEIYSKRKNLACPDFGNFIIESIKSKTINFDIAFLPVKFIFKNKNTVLDEEISNATTNIMKKFDFSHFTTIAVDYVYPEIKNTKFTVKMNSYDQKILFVVHSILDFLNNLTNINIEVTKGKITNKEIIDLFHLFKKDMFQCTEHIGCFCLLSLMFYVDREDIFYNKEINKIKNEIFEKTSVK